MTTHKRYFKNVPGDFYVEDGCCLICMIPEEIAPELMGYDDSDQHCFFKKQPENHSELYNAIKALYASEVECLRYAGGNPTILRRLAEADMAAVCDVEKIVGKVAPIVRNRVTFTNTSITASRELAVEFYRHLQKESSKSESTKLGKIKEAGGALTFTYSWYKDERYPLWFEPIGSEWHIFHGKREASDAKRFISVMIDEWLKSDPRFSDIRWFDDHGWNGTRTEWSPTAI